MAAITDYKFRVEPQDIDFTSRVRLSSLITSILNTAGQDADNKKFGVVDLNTANHTWVLSRMAVELDLRPKQNTEYLVRTWVSDWERLLSTRNFTLRTSQDQVFAHAVTQWAIIDLESRRPVNLSDHSIDGSGHIADVPSPIDKPTKLAKINPTHTREYKVTYSDIDFNKHVTSMSYVKIALDMLPIEIFESDAKLRLDIHFLRECLYGQTLQVECELMNDVALFEIKNNDGNVAFKASFKFL